MRNAFALSVMNNLTVFRDTEMRNCNNVLYVYDEKHQNDFGEEDGRTFLSSDDGNKSRALFIENSSEKEIVHICIDGGVIQYGKKCPDYIGDGKPHGRPDCMIFSNDKLLFVELKMDMHTEKDKGRWNRYSEAVGQLQDFLCNYFIPTYAKHNDKIENYYKKGSFYSIICMKTAPVLAGKRNSQRQSRRESFRTATNMDVVVTTTEIF